MMDLQNDAIRHGGFESGDPRVDELKQARRQYNRQDKYNISDLLGYTPQEANEIYRQNSGVLREHARPTYKDMYPISGMAHEVTGSGGITGLLLNEAFGKTKKGGKDFFEDLRTMGSDILGAIGIGGAVAPEEATEEVLQNYADKTFKPNMYDVTGPWFGTVPPLEDVKISDLPPRTGVDVVDDIKVTDQMPSFFDKWWKPWLGRQEETEVIPGYDTTYINEPVDDIAKYEDYLDRGIESISTPFDDSGREYGILLNQGLVSDPLEEFRSRRLQDEYMDYIERTGDRLTYDEFERAWERLHALPRGLHYQEPRAGIR